MGYIRPPKFRKPGKEHEFVVRTAASLMLVAVVPTSSMFAHADDPLCRVAMRLRATVVWEQML